VRHHPAPCLVALALALAVIVAGFGASFGVSVLVGLLLRPVLPLGALIPCTLLVFFLALAGFFVLVGVVHGRLLRRRREQFWARPQLSDEAFAALFTGEGQAVAAAVRNLLGERIAQDAATQRLLPGDHVVDLDLPFDELSGPFRKYL
jgi:hypothetical protein